MKECKICKNKKEINEFYQNGIYKKKDGTKIKKYKPNCKECEVNERRKIFIDTILEVFGSYSCSKCGYDKCIQAIEFHHLEPKEKEFSPSKLIHFYKEIQRKELKKCIPLCANCHREEHFCNHPPMRGKE